MPEGLLHTNSSGQQLRSVSGARDMTLYRKSM